jgi:Zn-dependent protease
MLRRVGSIKLMEVFGIRIGVDWGWFLTLFLVIIWLSPSFRSALGSSSGVAYLTTVISALLFFGSLIVHELGHALVARRQGIEVRNIQLFLFGGLTQMSREARTPSEEFKIAVAGPLATLFMVLVFAGIDLAIVGPNLLWDAIRLTPNIKLTPVLLSLSWLLLMNVIVLIFNLVPAFPLDGGRIVRAGVWRATGDKQRGTRTAAKLGQWFAVILAGIGIWLMLAGGAFGGLWLLLLAFLLGQSARGALMQTALTEKIEGVRVADIMDRQPVAIPAATPVGQALDEYFHRYGWSWFPVVDDRGHFLGIARQERVQTTIDGGEGWLTVGSAVEAGETSDWRVDEDRPLTELLSSEALGRLGALMAVDRDGVLQGVVTVDQVRRALQSAFGAPGNA